MPSDVEPQKEKIVGSKIYHTSLIISVSLILLGYLFMFLESIGFSVVFNYELLWLAGIIALLATPSILLLVTSSLMIIRKEKEKIVGYVGLVGFLILVLIIIYKIIVS